MTDLTPVERRGAVWVKRDDLFGYGGSYGGKVRTCLALGRAAAQAGRSGLVTAGSRQSPQVNIVATVAASLGLACRAHCPTGALTPELRAARNAGAVIVQHTPGYNGVIIARARADAEARGWAEVPFGMEHPEAVVQTAAQVANLAGVSFRRLVIPVGSGMSAAGVLAGLAAGGFWQPVVGIVVGASPERRLDRYAPGWRHRLVLRPAGMDYHRAAATTALSGLELDPIYEAKCLPHLLPGDLLWVVGCRETAANRKRPPVRAGAAGSGS